MLKSRHRQINILLRTFHSNINVSTARTSSQITAPAEARFVVIGGGLCGLSTVYQLAKRGYGQHTVLFEQTKCGLATAWLSSGFSPVHYWSNNDVIEISLHSQKMYREIAEKYPDINLRPASRLFLSCDERHTTTLKRMKALAEAIDNSGTILDGREARMMCAIMDDKDIHSALYIEDDVRLDPLALCDALRQESIDGGVTLIEGCRVRNVVVDDKTRLVIGVNTDYGYTSTDYVVDAAGMLYGGIPIECRYPVRIYRPQVPAYYRFLVMDPLAECDFDQQVDFDKDLVIHDANSGVYVAHQPNSALIAGGFIRSAMEAVPYDDPEFNPYDLKDDWDKFYPILERVVQRFPAIKGATVARLETGADTYTPDGSPIIGFSPEVANYAICSGSNGYGVSMAGGSAALMADFLLGTVTQSSDKVDVQRFLRSHSTKSLLNERAPEVASYSFENSWAYTRQWSTARNMRTSSIHSYLAQQGAVFGESVGYERALYFDSDKKITRVQGGGSIMTDGLPVWFPHVAIEYEACRERVGLIDMTSFAKFELTGYDEDTVVNFAQRIFSDDVDKPVGTCIYTGMQNEIGGYMSDMTVNRLAPDRYFIVAPSVQGVRAKFWFEHQAKAMGLEHKIIINDLTMDYTALNILGPSSRDLMQQLTNCNMSPHDFPSFRCRYIDVGLVADVIAISVSHCGELGWVLYIPNEFAQYVYRRIVEAGAEHGLTHAGYYTLRHLRIEKFYVFWGIDIGITTTPLECGRDFRVDFGKDFIGREALLKQKEEGVHRRYVQLLLDNHRRDTDPWPLGREPIYRNGRCVGWTTSSAFAFTLKKMACLGYIENPDPDDKTILHKCTVDYAQSGEYSIDIAGRKYGAKLYLRSPTLPMISSEHPRHFQASRVTA